MAAEQQQKGIGVAGISSRRTACDKCRFAKASPVFRLRNWQPPAAGTVEHVDPVGIIPATRSQPNKRRRREFEKQPPEASSVTTPSNSNGTLDEQLLNGGAAQSSLEIASNLGGDRPWNADAQAPHSLDDFYGPNLVENLDETLGNIDYDFDLDLSDQSFSTGASPTRADSAASPLSLQAQSIELPRGIGEIHGSTPAQSGPGSTAEYRNGRSADDTPLRKLSRLHHELMATHSHLAEGSPGVAMKTIFEADIESLHPSAMEQILNRTTEFAAILKLLAETHLPPAAASPVSQSMQITQDKRRSSASSISIYDHDSVFGSPANTITSTEQSSSSMTSLPAHEELDTSSLLLILAIYMRLLRLHSTVFAHVHQHLIGLSESDHPHLRPFLRFSSNSSFSMPSESGNLQILILIEIVTSLFDRLDALLGLPKELRMSRRRREQKGLLSTADFSDLTSLILRKDEQRGHEDGKGGIKALRRHLAGAKQLLRECIAP
ncbi:hypothetical protein diail_3284 [Diaporthe ilicicola]|nr:hypothetical protein diail_3284 [Diaporthe ilicicola]